IFAGEKVCIQATSPTQLSVLFASRHSDVISSGVFSTGLKTIRTGKLLTSLSDEAICRACSATCFKVSSPYRNWLPVINQASGFLRSVILYRFTVSCRSRHPDRAFVHNVF